MGIRSGFTSAVFGTLIGAFSSILILWMLIGVIRYGYPKKERTMRCWFVINVSIFICYLIFCITESIISIYSPTSSINLSFHVPWCQLRLHEMYGFIIAKILLYQFYLYQLHMVFKDSPFAISVHKLQLLGISVSVPIICLTILSFCILYEPAHYLSNPKNAAEWDAMNINSFNECHVLYIQYLESDTLLYLLFNICTMVYALNDIVFSIIILRLFISRTLLYTLRLSKIESIHEGSAHVVIKITNLIILSVTTNYIIFIKYAFGADASIYTIDAFCNCLSIYLSYKFSSSLYEVLYGRCHSSCYGVCVKLCVCCCLPKALSPEQRKAISTLKTADVALESKQIVLTRTTATTAATSRTTDTCTTTVPTTTSPPIEPPHLARDPTPFEISDSNTIPIMQSDH